MVMDQKIRKLEEEREVMKQEYFTIVNQLSEDNRRLREAMGT